LFDINDSFDINGSQLSIFLVVRRVGDRPWVDAV